MQEDRSQPKILYIVEKMTFRAKNNKPKIINLASGRGQVEQFEAMKF